MAVNKNYALAAWTWNDKLLGGGSHVMPAGASACIDLRPIGEQAVRKQSGGFGFFAFDGVLPIGAIPLGSGDLREIIPSTTALDEMRIKLGLTAKPSGAKLVDCLADVLGPLSVPDGSSGAKPNMPTTDGDFELHLAGHSRVFRSPCNFAEILSSNPKGHANKIRDVIRAGIDKAFAIGGLVLCGKVLGGILKQHGYSLAEIDDADKGNTGKKTEWERLLSVDKRGSVKPKKPTTTYTETWPTTQANIASGEDLAWVAMTPGGSGWVGTLQASGGYAYQDSGRGAWSICRAPGSLSSADHSVTAPLRIDAASGHACGTMARLHSANAECYHGYGYFNVAMYVLSKWVAGTNTTLGSVGTTFSGLDVSTVQTANGSTISFAPTGVSPIAVTDTAVTGNLYGGINALSATPANAQIKSWVLTDLSVAPVAAFSGTPLTGTAPLSVAFTDASSNSPTSWLWEKNSGSGWVNFAGTPTVQNPTESFAAGTWSVKLTATNAAGSDDEIKTGYVVASAAGGDTNSGVLGSCGVDGNVSIRIGL